MIFRTALLGGLACLTTGALLADFRYEESSKITGGAMAGMMKIAGAFSKSAREPIRSTVMVKGNRMAQITGDSIQVTDLDKETITSIDTKKRQYSVVTFAEMAQFMEQMAQKASQQKSQNKDAQKAEVDFKVSVKETGEKKQVAGLEATRMILTMAMEGTDKESGEKGSMTVTSDMWMAQSAPGYEEVQEFYKKMAQKLNWMPRSGMSGMANAQPEMAKGMSEIYKEAAKLNGVPVLQVVRMGVAGAGGEMPAGAAPAEGGEQAQVPSAGQAAGGAAAGAASGRLGRAGGIGGALGGFGGFGRRKKKEQQEEAPPPAAPPQTASGAPAGGGGVLMEMTTELTGFSNAPLDGSQLEVPAGFKQVESEMVKALRK